MTTFTSLLVATDFSVDGNNAVRRAALLAHEHGAGLHILHMLKASGCKPLRRSPLGVVQDSGRGTNVAQGQKDEGATSR